jgi:hypothetical protein
MKSGRDDKNNEADTNHFRASQNAEKGKIEN